MGGGLQKSGRFPQFYRLDSGNLRFCKSASCGGTSTVMKTLEAKLKQKVLDFLSDESGATAIEYGLIAAGISLAIIAIVNTLGGTLDAKFTAINTSLK